MKLYRITYADGGFDTVHAADFWAACAKAKNRERKLYRRVVSVALVD